MAILGFWLASSPWSLLALNYITCQTYHMQARLWVEMWGTILMRERSSHCLEERPLNTPCPCVRVCLGPGPAPCTQLLASQSLLYLCWHLSTCLPYRCGTEAPQVEVTHWNSHGWIRSCHWLWCQSRGSKKEGLSIWRESV